MKTPKEVEMTQYLINMLDLKRAQMEALQEEVKALEVIIRVLDQGYGEVTHETR